MCSQMKVLALLSKSLIIFAAIILSGNASAEIYGKVFRICSSPNTISCDMLEFWRLGDYRDDIGSLWIKMDAVEADESSVLFEIEFTNNTECKLNLDGYFRRNDQAVAVVDWGNLQLQPGEKRKGKRHVYRLRDMQIGEEINFRISAQTITCNE